MPSQNAEAAALVLGAHGDDVRVVEHHGCWGCNQKPHEGLASRFEECSLSRASSIVPTM